MSPFDRWLFWRTLVLTALGLVAAALVVGLTDEAYASAGARSARLAAMAPGLAAASVIFQTAQLRVRGESVALGALGAGPWRVARGAALASAVVGLLAVVLLLTPWAEPRALFPTVSFDIQWVLQGSQFWEPNHGIRLHSDGSLFLLPPAPRSPAGQEPSWAWPAVLALLPVALGAPVWSSSPLSPARRIAGAGLFAALLVGLLHAAAATRISANWLSLAGVALFVEGAIGHCRAKAG